MPQALAGAPFTLLNAAVLTLIMYGLIGLRYTASAVLLTIVTVGLLSLVGVQILVLSAYLTNSQDLAFVVAVTYVTWSILLGGFIVRLSQLYSVLRGLSYLFPLRYTFQALVLLQVSTLPTVHVCICRICMPKVSISAT
jgi:ABC-type multidrug transport system permease subunit